MIKIRFKVILTFILLIIVAFLLIGCLPTVPKSVPTTENETESNSINDTDRTDYNNEYQFSEPNDSKVEMVFMGDVMMDSFIADYINDYGVDYPWTDVSEILNDADIAVVNLETSVSNNGSTKKPKGYGFRSAPETLEGLKNSGIDIVSLANNHVMDYGNDAFYDTLNYLNDYNIKYVGAGNNISKAVQPVVFEQNGIKVGFLSFSSIIPWDEWRATEDSPGVAYFTQQDYDMLLRTIILADDSVDILTVILHWGTEYQTTPSNWQINLAHEIIDSGADLIVGHHPHVLQGIEIYKDKPILYSIGNFVFLKKDDEAGKTGIFKLIYDKKGFIGGTIYPVNIKYTKANLLKEDDPMKKEIIDILANLSRPLDTNIDSLGNFSLK